MFRSVLGVVCSAGLALASAALLSPQALAAGPGGSGGHGGHGGGGGAARSGGGGGAHGSFSGSHGGGHSGNWNGGGHGSSHSSTSVSVGVSLGFGGGYFGGYYGGGYYGRGYCGRGYYGGYYGASCFYPGYYSYCAPAYYSSYCAPVYCSPSTVNTYYYTPAPTSVVVIDRDSQSAAPPVATTNNADRAQQPSGTEVALAWALLGDGEEAKARRLFGTMASNFEGYGPVKVGYALAAAFDHDNDTAVWAMRRALRMDPDRLMYVPVDQKLGVRMEKLLDQYGARLQSKPGDADTLFMVASVQYFLNLNDAALHNVQSAIGLGDATQSSENLRRLAFARVSTQDRVAPSQATTAPAAAGADPYAPPPGRLHDPEDHVSGAPQPAGPSPTGQPPRSSNS